MFKSDYIVVYVLRIVLQLSMTGNRSHVCKNKITMTDTRIDELS